MAILVDKTSRVLVQGITGREGHYHATQCHAYGGNVVAGVTPGKGGQKTLEGKVPIFNSCEEAVQEAQANVSVIFVPALHASGAIIEAASAGIGVIVCITEGIPVHDMVKVKAFLREYPETVLIGPNCPGLLTPEEAKVGIMPGFIAKKGKVGVISKSGTLTYEAIAQIGAVGLGQSTCVGIGGDPVIGTDMIRLLSMFEEDTDTEAIVIIGEIGGTMEVDAAHYVKQAVTKPVIGFIAGMSAPAGRRMGHAGAIVSGKGESAHAKAELMRSCGITVSDSPATIGSTLKAVL